MDDNTITQVPAESAAPTPPTPQPKKKRHTKLWIALVTVLVVLGLPLLIAGYFGFVPGLSGLMGATKPRDLGVKYSEADYQSYLAKTQAQFLNYENAPENPLKPGRKTIFADPRSVENLAVTQEEITAAINTVGWAWMPITNAQVKFGDNNSVEVSGNLNIEHIDDFIRFIGGVGYSDADVDKAISWGEKFIGEAAVYAKGQASVENGLLSLSVDQVQVGRFAAPVDIADKVFQVATTNALTRAENFNANAASFQDGQMLFTGTYPTTVYVKK